MSIDRIDITHHGIDNNRSLNKAQEARAKDPTARSDRGTSPSPDDTVALSSKAREIGRLSHLARESGDRAARINQIRDAIQNGTYKVSGEEIANKIIEAHQK